MDAVLRLFRFVTEGLVWIAYPILWLYGRFHRIVGEGLQDRMGFFHIEPQEKVSRCVVFCCASIGEVGTAEPAIRAWRARRPEETVVVATTTPTGKRFAQRRFNDDAGVVAYLRPLDLGRCPARWLEALDARRVILVETELWPLFLRESIGRRLPVHVINGRISDRSYPSYHRLKWLFAPLVGRFASVAVQNGLYRKRFINLGVPDQRVIVSGNLKYCAIREPTPISPELDELLSIFSRGRSVLVAGSTHPGEENTVLEAYRELVQHFPDLRLVIAPRHLERIHEVEAVVRDTGFPYALRSRLDSQRADQAMIVILDTHGELAGAYKHATIAYVGGSLVDVGGHNILEPATFAVPVLYGPYIDNFIDEAMLLERAGGSATVADFRTLAVVLHDLLGDPQKAKHMGNQARQVLSKVEGVLAKTLDTVFQSGTVSPQEKGADPVSQNPTW